MLFFTLGCSSQQSITQFSTIPNYRYQYQLIDRSGNFTVEKSGGRGRNNFVILKSKISNGKKILEQSTIVSKIGKYKNIIMARPEKSIYQVWFEGKQYKTTTKVISKKKIIQLNLTSPEEQWNGIKEIKFKYPNMPHCYFSQVIDCVSITGFLKKAIELKNGEMKLVIIWEGYPYMQEQYINIPKEVFTSALLTYDGKNKAGDYRFSLDIGTQKILYFVNPNQGTFTKMFWVSQGLSMIKNN